MKIVGQCDVSSKYVSCRHSVLLTSNSGILPDDFSVNIVLNVFSLSVLVRKMVEKRSSSVEMVDSLNFKLTFSR